MKSKTVWGGVILGVAQVITDHSVGGITRGIGTILAAIGVKHAIVKVGDQ